MDIIVRAADILKTRREIRFEFFGNGPTRDSVMKLAQELGLGNVHFHDPVPKRDVPGLLAAANVALMCLFRSPLIHIYFENKFIDYMGAGKPILAAMEGEQAEIIRRHRTGRIVQTFDFEGLGRLVNEASDNFSAFAEMGENGRKLVREKLLLPSILDRYAAMLEAIAGDRTCKIQVSEPAL
jgi:glycosyltransferase involved in cell wall biosynthesis